MSPSSLSQTASSQPTGNGQYCPFLDVRVRSSHIPSSPAFTNKHTIDQAVSQLINKLNREGVIYTLD